jgi:hypothetical protein
MVGGTMKKRYEVHWVNPGDGSFNVRDCKTKIEALTIASVLRDQGIDRRARVLVQIDPPQEVEK